VASYADEAIITHTLKQAIMTNIIGKRLYHIQAPQDAVKPYGVYNIVDPSNLSEEFKQSRAGQPLVQIDFVSDDSKTPCDAFLAAHAFMDIFANLTGTIESVAFRYFEIRGPRTIPSSQLGENICIVEIVPHYTEP
jgi:hypothetical protein